MNHEYTATGFVLNKNSDKILLIFHKKLQIWLPPGGHVESGELPHQTVKREVFEETGISAEVVSSHLQLEKTGDKEKQLPTPICIFEEKIPQIQNKQAHLHIDFLYVLNSKEETITPALAEVSDSRWFSYQEVLALDTTQGVKEVCKHILKL